MPTYLTFDPTSLVSQRAGWVIPPGLDTVAALLRAHGVVMRRLDRDTTLRVIGRRVDSVVVAARPFQGHRLVRVTAGRGEPVTASRVAPAGSWLVLSRQRLGILATVLLEPDSDDGVHTWGLLGDRLRVGSEYPIWQLDWSDER
jgi:hypothetical protein